MDRLRALLGVTSRDTELLLGSSDGDDASQGGADRTRSASPSAEETHWVVKSLPGDLRRAEPRRSAPPLPPTYSIRGRERKPSAKAAAAVAAAVGPGLTAAAATVPAAAAPKGKGKGAPAKAPAAAAPPAAPARPVVITHVPAQGASPLKRRAAGGVEGVAPSPIKYRGPNGAPTAGYRGRGASANDDGSYWRKYGEKATDGGQVVKAYYRCTEPKCPARKVVERDVEGAITKIEYRDEHNHGAI